MIQLRSIIKIADNSGAKTVGVIKVVEQGSPDAAKLGNVVVASVKTTAPRSIVKKKEIVRGVIVRTSKPTRRADGSMVRFDDNAIVLINPDGSPRGTRIFGPIARETRDRGFSKIISLAEEVV